MATKKRYSDINKAIKEAEARREEYYKQVGRVMLEEYPELGDMNVTDMRRAARFLRDNLPEKASSKGAEAGKATAQNGAPAASDSGGDSAHDAREPMPVRACKGGSRASIRHPARGVRRALFRMESSAESSAETGWEQGTPGGSKGTAKAAPSRAGRVHTKRRYFSPQRKNRKFCRDKSHARYLFSLRKHLREIASNRRGRLIEKREVLIWQ